jgi:hypothetical protein
MAKILLFLLSLTFIILVSCGETKDKPLDKDKNSQNISDNSDESILLNASIGYFKSLQIKVKSVKEQKIINLKNGDSFYFIGIKDENGKKNAISVQFTGTYNGASRNLDSVVVISCDNQGGCPECVLTAQGNCGVLSCSCADNSGIGAYDCTLMYNEISEFKKQFYIVGKDLIKDMDIPKLEVLNCPNF